MDDWPTHSQELSRKVLSVIERLIEDQLNGADISARDVEKITACLYDVTSGLVPKAVSETILAVYEGAKT